AEATKRPASAPKRCASSRSVVRRATRVGRGRAPADASAFAAAPGSIPEPPEGTGVGFGLGGMPGIAGGCEGAGTMPGGRTGCAEAEAVAGSGTIPGGAACASYTCAGTIPTGPVYGPALGSLLQATTSAAVLAARAAADTP